MENNKPNSEIIIYQGDGGESKIEVRLTGETVWLSQQQIAELYQSSRINIVEHIKRIYVENEMDESATCRKFRQVRIEGGRKVDRELPFYSLEMIIALGYRVNSSTATKFRQWAYGTLARIHRQILDIYATSVDYDSSADISMEFFKILRMP